MGEVEVDVEYGGQRHIINLVIVQGHGPSLFGYEARVYTAKAASVLYLIRELDRFEESQQRLNTQKEHTYPHSYTR